MNPAPIQPSPDLIVTIAGCGAVGSYLAARLIQGGFAVQAYQRSGPQLRAIQTTGVVVEGDPRAGESPYRLHAASDDPAELEPTALAVVCVKSYHTSALSPLKRLLTSDGRILTLQNGVGNAEWLTETFGPHRVCAGTISYGARRIAPGVVRWGGEGSIEFGPWGPAVPGSDPEHEQRWIAHTLTSAGLEATWVADPRPALWTKLALNAMINPLATLLRVPNGTLRDRPTAMEMMERIGRETIAAAGRAGVSLVFGDVWSRLVSTLDRTAVNRCSMLQDVESGRPTEIDGIIGPVLRHADSPESVPCSTMLYSLITAMDEAEPGADRSFSDSF